MLRFLALCTVGVLVLAPQPAHAAKIKLGDESFLNVGILLQSNGLVARRAAPEEGYGSDLYLRRIRVLVSGDVSSRLSFFVDVDQPNLGKGGNWDPSFFVQDAVLSFALVPKDLYIDAGMMLPALTRHGLQGAGSLSTLDYHSSVIKYPAGKVWRDAGAQLRWYGLDHRLQIRGGVFEGVGSVGVPRATAHARWNFLGREDGLFFSGQSFSGTPVLSVGIGADYQQRANTKGGDYAGLAADLYGELPTAENQAVIFQVAVLRFANGYGAASTGLGGYAEAGYRVGWINPVVSAEYFDSDKPGSDYLALRPGVNLWVEKHAFNLKLEAGVLRQGNLRDAPYSFTGAAQLQLAF